MKYSRKKRRYDDVLAEIHDIHDSFTEEEYYDSLYYILGDTYPDASEEELEEIFEEMLENMSEQQAEDFMSSLGSIGKKIGSGPELLSTIGGIAGNLILPGAGGMIGGALGSAAGGLLQNKNAQNNLQQQQQQNPNAIVNPDAAKLNSLMQDPQMQRALMQMSTSNVPIAPLTSNGQTTHVPIANFLHALIRQAQAALQQLDALIPPQVQEALAENFGEDFAGEDLGEALLEEVTMNGGWVEETKFRIPTKRDPTIYPVSDEPNTIFLKQGYTLVFHNDTNTRIVDILINIVLVNGSTNMLAYNDGINTGVSGIQSVITNNLNTVYNAQSVIFNGINYTTNLVVRFLVSNIATNTPDFPTLTSALSANLTIFPPNSLRTVADLPTQLNTPANAQRFITNQNLGGQNFCIFSLGAGSFVPGLGNRTIFVTAQDVAACARLGRFIIAHEFAHMFGLDDRYWWYQVLSGIAVVPFNNDNYGWRRFFNVGFNQVQAQTQVGNQNPNSSLAERIPIFIPGTYDQNYETNNNLMSVGLNQLTALQWGIILNTAIVEALPIDCRMRTVFGSNRNLFSSAEAPLSRRVWSICVEQVKNEGITDGEGDGIYNPPMEGQIRVRCKERVRDGNSGFIERYITSDIKQNPDNRAIMEFVYWGHPRYLQRCSQGNAPTNTESWAYLAQANLQPTRAELVRGGRLAIFGELGYFNYLRITELYN